MFGYQGILIIEHFLFGYWGIFFGYQGMFGYRGIRMFGYRGKLNRMFGYLICIFGISITERSVSRYYCIILERVITYYCRRDISIVSLSK